MLAALSSLQEALGENLCPGSFRLLAKFSSIRLLDLGPCFLAGCQLGTALGSQGCSLVLALLPLLLLSRCSRQARALGGGQERPLQVEAQEGPGTEAEALADQTDEVRDDSASVQVDEKPERRAVRGAGRRVPGQCSP